MLTYKTRDGDVVDDIVFRHYGALNPAMLLQVFEANPGLADRGAVLPANVAIALPAIAQPASLTKAVALWD
jgi:phage tail protein X